MEQLRQFVLSSEHKWKVMEGQTETENPRVRGSIPRLGTKSTLNAFDCYACLQWRLAGQSEEERPSNRLLAVGKQIGTPVYLVFEGANRPTWWRAGGAKTLLARRAGRRIATATTTDKRLSVMI
ncbi:MAG: hypothetical protein ACYDAG_16535 [Chloroflexota bacterium]